MELLVAGSPGANVAESCRYQVLYAGRVQGVGFRATTAQIAARHPVAGYVRNLPDGRVELVCQGERSAVDRFLADVRETMNWYIRSETVEPAPSGESFVRFEVRH